MSGTTQDYKQDDPLGAEDGNQAAELQEGLEHTAELADQGEEKPKGKAAITALIALGVVVLAFAVVVIFFAVQLMEGNDAGDASVDDPGLTVGAAGTNATEAFLTAPIVVAHQTDFVVYNASYREDGVVDLDLGAQVQPEDEELVFPPPGQSGDQAERPAATPAQNQTNNASNDLGTNYANLLNIDVLDAQARARAHGYVVHQVFVVPPDVVNGNARAPRPGAVVEVQTFTMRGDGQRYMFLHVMTTDPVANARAVPNLRGMQWQSGRDSLRSAGLGARFAYERSSQVTKGEVIFQAPQAGRFTPAGSTVIMVLAD